MTVYEFFASLPAILAILGFAVFQFMKSHGKGDPATIRKQGTLPILGEFWGQYIQLKRRLVAFCSSPKKAFLSPSRMTRQ